VHSVACEAAVAVARAAVAAGAGPALAVESVTVSRPA
jgi:hypothetical protein